MRDCSNVLACDKVIFYNNNNSTDSTTVSQGYLVVATTAAELPATAAEAPRMA